MTILKAIGISPKRILYPFFGFAALVAGIWLFIIHPAGLFLEARYNENVSPNNASVEINRDVWIDCRKNDKLIFVKSICGNEIEGLNVFDIKNNSKIFAQKAISRKDVWHLENVAMVNNDKIKNVDFMEIPCVVSPNLLELISKSSRKQNIYYLYEIYKIQKKDKVTLRLYELELHNLLANCFCFLLFALIAAVICFPINRYKTKTDIAIKALFAAMLLRFANNALESLAYGGAIPPQFACWAVPLILTLVSIAVLIWREA
jgi:lipopolysaccharide export LptBFGC system permease protein LptF